MVGNDTSWAIKAAQQQAQGGITVRPGDVLTYALGSGATWGGQTSSTVSLISSAPAQYFWGIPLGQAGATTAASVRRRQLLLLT